MGKPIFDSIRSSRPKLNKFDLSHEKKLSFNMGDLIPVMVQECLPGDVFRVTPEIMARLAPMLAPVMHRVDLRTEFFSVPYRLIYNEFEPFITGGQDGNSTAIPPYMMMQTANAHLFQKGMLPDYMGIPPVEGGVIASPGVPISVLYFRAYQAIYNAYYRDPTLTTEVAFPLNGGNRSDMTELTNLTTLRKRSWEKDYFTSALPFPQRGDDVSLPIAGESGDVQYRDQSDIVAVNPSTNQVLGTGNLSAGKLVAWDGVIQDPMDPHETPARVENILSFGFDATDVTINLLRRAVKLQEWLEKSARGGYRYIEQNLVHFGVKSSDARLQRPEYLGGSKQSVMISEVLSTYQADDGEIPQGNMSGRGISVGNQGGFKRRFEEHCIVIGIMSVIPRTCYQQGIARMWQRFDKFDYYWPTFAHLGEQAIKKGELVTQWSDLTYNDATFGYQSRYCEYKYGLDSVHGDFRDSLSFWHMGRILDTSPTQPALDASFVECNPTHRIFPVIDPVVNKVYCQIYLRVDALRPMPYFGTPSF